MGGPGSGQWQRQTLEQIAQRFWSKVGKRTEQECWEWQARKNACGYGTFKVHNRSILAHVMAWELTMGIVPQGFEVCHNCPGPRGDNPACCNPSHLWLGTHAQNMGDAKHKGRMLKEEGMLSVRFTEQEVLAMRAAYARGESSRSIASRYHMGPSHCLGIVTGKYFPELSGAVQSRGLPIGQDNPSSKLRDEQVVLIRKRYEAGEKRAALAREYHVSFRTIRLVVLRETYKHL